MRLFVALNLPAELRRRIAADVLTPLRKRLPDVRWVREETLHVTLLFLGERNEAETHEAQAVVREVAAAHEPFKASLAGLGAFPVPARPRVVWLGLEGLAPMHELHRALRREHDRLGMPRENRAYRPHVTLGRVLPTAEADTGASPGTRHGAVRGPGDVQLG